MSGSFPEIKPGEGLFNINATVIFKDLKSPLNLEVLPSFTYCDNSSRETIDYWKKGDVENNFGVSVKYGITSSITAEATINPDFSQVESDAFQVEVNQRYPVFYSEKRPFFMEGMDIFDFNIISHGMLMTPVHTRRIVDPEWGSKITGSLGSTSFGILAAGDEFPGYEWEDEKNPNEGKNANFGIARVKYSVGRDNYIGAIYSGREFAGLSNHVVGSDIQFRVLKNANSSVSVLYSNTDDADKGVVTRGADLNWWYSYNSRSLSYSAAFEHIDKDFQMETSFLMRTNLNRGWIWIGPRFYPDAKKVSWLKRITPEFIAASLHDIETDQIDQYYYVGINLNFTKQGSFSCNYEWDKEFWHKLAYQQNSMGAEGGLQITKWFRFGGFFSHGGKIYYGEDSEDDPSYLGSSVSGGFNFTFQPNEKLNQYFQIYHQNFSNKETGENVYKITIVNFRNTYQFNKYLFVRATIRYDSYNEKMLTDFLTSFTFIPGTVVHLGYGSIYNKNKWQQNEWLPGQGKYYEMQRSLFFKASYLHRF
ncbi:hypothetical protein B6I21_03935 [candidate division KSB1 bacterium 4572_119]|nr:MAG: hypothetical protein B6I21_03935 [candidate division KSB1 bacterium 4572_119]